MRVLLFLRIGGLRFSGDEVPSDAAELSANSQRPAQPAGPVASSLPALLWSAFRSCCFEMDQFEFQNTEDTRTYLFPDDPCSLNASVADLISPPPCVPVQPAVIPNSLASFSPSALSLWLLHVWQL